VAVAVIGPGGCLLPEYLVAEEGHVGACPDASASTLVFG
jgi:hypothetical protein